MNQDVVINRLSNALGVPRAKVIDVLKRMSSMPEVQKELKKK